MRKPQALPFGTSSSRPWSPRRCPACSPSGGVQYVRSRPGPFHGHSASAPTAPSRWPTSAGVLAAGLLRATAQLRRVLSGRGGERASLVRASARCARPCSSSSAIGRSPPRRRSKPGRSRWSRLPRTRRGAPRRRRGRDAAAREPAAPGAAPYALRRRVESALAAPALPAVARKMVEGEFLHLARACARAATSGARGSRRSRRRAVVRRVEEYLDASRAGAAVARGARAASPARASARSSTRSASSSALALIALPAPAPSHAVRRELRAGPPAREGRGRATRWGFWQLGRFAVEYRTLFGERPLSRHSTCPRP